MTESKVSHIYKFRSGPERASARVILQLAHWRVPGFQVDSTPSSVLQLDTCGFGT
jgi:hypothetical protein